MNTIQQAVIEAWTSRRAWWFTATARTKARFARTILGSLWFGLSTLLSVGLLALVYGTVFKVPDFSHYVIFIGVGLVTWNSLSSSISSAPTLMDHNINNLKNTNLNPLFYALEEWAFHCQTFVQSFALVILALSLLKNDLWINLVAFGFIPLLNLLIFMFWLPTTLCILGARYKDLYQLVPLVLQLLFLLSPILYYKENLGHLQWTAHWNPIYLIIGSVRDSIIEGKLNWQGLFAMTAINCLGVFASLKLLQKERPYLPFLI